MSGSPQIAFFSSLKRMQLPLALAILPLAIGAIIAGSRQLSPSYAVTIEPSIVDLGSINQGETREVAVTIRNNSDNIISVLPTALSSCSCVRPVGGTVDLMPRERREFPIAIDTRTVPGQWERRVGFYISGLPETKPFLGLATVKAKVLPEYELIPDRIRYVPTNSVSLGGLKTQSQFMGVVSR